MVAKSAIQQKQESRDAAAALIGLKFVVHSVTTSLT